MLRRIFLLLVLSGPSALADDAYDDYCSFAPEVCAEFVRHGWDLRPAFRSLTEGFEEVAIDGQFIEFLAGRDPGEVLRFFERYQLGVDPLPDGHADFAAYYAGVLHETPEFFAAFAQLSRDEAAAFGERLGSTRAYEFWALTRTLALKPARLPALLKLHLSQLASLRVSAGAKFSLLLDSLQYKDWQDLARASQVAEAWTERYLDFLDQVCGRNYGGGPSPSEGG